MCFSKNKNIASCFLEFINSRESLAIIALNLDFHEIINNFQYTQNNALIQLSNTLTLTHKLVETSLHKDNCECYSKIVIIHEEI